MPSFFYHIKFEVYPTPDTCTAKASNRDTLPNTGTWLPIKHLDIFGDLPFHPRRKHQASGASLGIPQDISVYDLIPRLSPEVQGALLETPPSLIDCGSSRGAIHDKSKDSDTVAVFKRQPRDKPERLPTPSSSAGIGPHVAVKDWRFAQLNIESFDKVRQDIIRSPVPQARAMDGDPHPLAGRRPAPDVGPNMGQLGTATKARFVPLDVKNTEVGWGVVHLYREGDESPELDRADYSDDELDETQCTTLCIPAIPSGPGISDFLNFVGPQWLPHIVHWRLVLTGDRSTYLVLMKFRDSKKAKLFRDQYNGRAFQELGVCECTALPLTARLPRYELILLYFPHFFSNSWEHAMSSMYAPSPSRRRRSLKMVLSLISHTILLFQCRSSLSPPRRRT